MTARRFAEDEDDLGDVMAVFEDLDGLTRECVVDVGRRAVLVVRLLEIGHQAADRETARQLLRAVFRIGERMTNGAHEQCQ